MAIRDGRSANGRHRVESIFEAWGYFVVRNRWAALTISLITTGWLISYLPGLSIDNSTESFLLADDPAVVVYNDLRDQFGRDDRILLAIEAPDLFSIDFLERLRDLHHVIEADVRHVEQVDSFLNARVIHGLEQELIVGELLEDWPRTPEDLARIRETVLSNPLYRNALVSADGTMTALSITPSTFSSLGQPDDALAGFGDEQDAGLAAPVYLRGVEGDDIIRDLLEVVEHFDAADFRLHLAGALVMTYRINQGMTHDMGIFMPVTLALMCVVLGLLFRRVGGVILPVLVVVLSLGATVGMMILMGIQGSAAVQILPVFLLTVGICDAVHILAIVYRLRMQGECERDAIAHAIGHSGLAVFMTSATTAIGMASFALAEMASVRDLGVLAPIGVGLAFLYTLILLPALLAIFPLAPPKRGRLARGLFPLEGFLVACGSLAVRSPARILVPAGLLSVLAVLGALQTSFSHNGLTWFPEDDRVRVDFTAIDEHLGGSVNLDLLIDTGEPGGLYDPAILTEIERIGLQIGNLAADPIVIGKTFSIVDVIEETHQALNENRPEMRRIPDTREAVAQEMLLFENSGSDDTQELVDADFQVARMSLRVPFCDALAFPPFLEKLDALLAKRLAGRAEFKISGLMMLLSKIFDSMIRSMLNSYVFALILITPLMMLLVGSFRRGLVSMIPNLMPVVAVLGIMGWLGLALDSTTMMVGAMVIGIAVDDTIHFLHNFNRYDDETRDLEFAVCETMRTTGSAMLFTSIVLAAGFSIFALGDLANTRIFGLLSAFAAVVAFVADLVVTPALLAVVERSRSVSVRGPRAAEWPVTG